MHRRVTGFAALCLALAACVSPTPYQPAVKGENGYEDIAVERDRILVSFHGNSATPRSTVESSLLYRAAEVTLARGGDHFIVLDRDVERDGDYFGYGSNFGVTFGTGFGTRTGTFARGAFIGSEFGGPIYSDVPEYSAAAEILIRSGPAPEDDVFAFDARDVLDNVGPRLIFPSDRG